MGSYDTDSQEYKDMQAKIQAERAEREAKIEELKAKGVSGIITDARFTKNPDGANVSGYCVVDTKGRGFSGYDIHTSVVRRVYQEDEQWYVKTHYSLYQVTWGKGVTIPQEYLINEDSDFIEPINFRKV